VGPFAPALPGSELAKLRGEALPDGLPQADISAVRSAHDAVREAVRSGTLSSAHDIAEGGLAVALAESALAGGIGARVTIAPDGDAWTRLFGESPGRGFVVSGPAEVLEALGAEVLGEIGGDGLTLTAGDVVISATLAELREAHRSFAALFP
jgi:phosphoribosylformylglycinamidine synthase subunit PurL